MNKPLLYNWPRILWIVFVLSLPAVIIYSYFKKVFACPACYLFEDTGDGLKNYYTLAYYVQHDKGWHFSGMNYPYGENIIYTDNEPILAMTLKWVDQHIMDMDRHVVGTLNMLLLLSLYLAILITYILLRRWKVGRWWALASAVCMVFLSPQLWRLHGHYALAYLFFLPLLFLLLDLVVRQEKRRWLWSILCGGMLIIMSLTHMYFLLISLVMLFSFFVFWWWYHRKEKTLLRAVLPWLAGVIILPTLILMGIRHSTDTIKDRPVEPYGIDVHTVTFASTFFPFFSPFDKTWTVILKQDVPNFERNAYTGLIGLLMLPAILFFLFQRRDDEPLTVHVKAFLGAAVMSWLMGAGVFYQNGFKFLWELIPVLKQFRGLGRLGLSFYYLYMLVCSYLLWKLFFRMRHRGMGGTAGYALTIMLIIWGFEAYMHSKLVIDTVFKENRYLADAKDDYVPLLEKSGHKPEDFQAILSLPLVSIGNENVGVARGFWTLRESFHASMETGLPIIDYAMSRTSISQGLDIIELISSPYFEKTRLNRFNDKPVLLLCEEDLMVPAERRLIDMADSIGKYQTVTLYSLSIQSLKKISLPKLPDTINDSSCSGWYDGFENTRCDTAMTGHGALVIKSVPRQLWAYTDTAHAESQWQVTFWSHIDHQNGMVPVPRIVETDPQGKVLSNEGLGRERIVWSEAYREWIQVSLPLTMRGNGSKYELYIDNSGVVVDNLMIKPVGDTCIMHFPEMILYNNLPISPP